MYFESLKNELANLKIEEEAKRVLFYRNKELLQECWDKYISLSAQIQSYKDEIEKVQLEIILNSVSPFEEDSHDEEAIDGATPVTSLDAADRLVQLKNARNKFRLKESLRHKVYFLEEKQAESKRLIRQLTEELRRSLGDSTDDLYANLDNITNSMQIRKRLLDLNTALEQTQREYLAAQGDLERVEAECLALLNLPIVRHQLAESGLDQSESIDPLSHSTPQEFPPDRDTSPSALDPEIVQDILSSGPGLSEDLSHAIRKLALTPNGTEEKKQVLLHTRVTKAALDSSADSCLDISLDEALAAGATGSGDPTYKPVIDRANGEAPKAYLIRLEKRLISLEYLKAELQQEFNHHLESLKNSREQVNIIQYL